MAARNRGRRTRRDVLPYKSASVWCTAINLNDLSPPRACFGIQEPQRGLLACQGCSSFGLPPPPCGTALLIRTCGWERDWLQHAHYLPLSSGLDSLPVPQSQHVTPLELRQKNPSGRLAANYCAPPPLRANKCVFVVCYIQHCRTLTVGSAVFLGRQCHPLYQVVVVLVWPLQGVISQRKMNIDPQQNPSNIFVFLQMCIFELN